MLLRLVLIILGLLIVSVLALIAVGATLPRAHVARMSARFARPPQEVWTVITDYRAFPSWRKDVTSVEELPAKNGLPAWRERGANGVIPLETLEMHPPTRLVTRIADPKLPFGGTWTYEVAPEGDGSRVTITENGEIYNPAFRVMARYLFGYHATATRYLRALGRKFGEDSSPRREI